MAGWVKILGTVDNEAAVQDAAALDGQGYVTRDTNRVWVKQGGVWVDTGVPVDPDSVPDMPIGGIFLNQLLDVDTYGTYDGVALAYDAATGKWSPSKAPKFTVSADPPDNPDINDVWVQL